MVNYADTRIYKIIPLVPHEPGEVYIGSTTKKYLSYRLAHHTWSYNKDKQRTRAWVLFDKYGIENCGIELIEEYPCKTIEEKRMREAHHIQTLPCVNKNIPGRTRQETQKAWRDSHKERENTRSKEWRLAHPDYYKEYYKKQKEAKTAKTDEIHTETS